MSDEDASNTRHLPTRVQPHFARGFPRQLSLDLSIILTLHPVPDNQIGLLSSTVFAGMMFGAVGWGTCTLTCLSALKPKTYRSTYHPQAPISWVVALRSTQLYSLPLSSAWPAHSPQHFLCFALAFFSLEAPLGYACLSNYLLPTS